VGLLLGGVALLRCCGRGCWLGWCRHGFTSVSRATNAGLAGFTRVSRAINGTVRVAYDWIKDSSTGAAAN